MRRTQSFIHYQKVKAQILQAIKEAEQAEAAKNEAAIEAAIQALIKQKESMWKHRILH